MKIATRIVALSLLAPIPFVQAESQRNLLQPENSDWIASDLSPSQIAKSVDARLHSLKWWTLSYNFEFHNENGRGYTPKPLMCAVESPSVFHLEYPYLGFDDKHALEKILVVSDGKRIAKTFGAGRAQPVVLPFKAMRPLPKDYLRSWPRDSVSNLLSAVGTSNNPLTQLVNEASRPGSGFIASSSKRTLVLNGKVITYYRIFVDGRYRRREMVSKGHTGHGDKTLKPASSGSESVHESVEIVVQSPGWLPTSVNTYLDTRKGKFYSYMNRNEWKPIRNKHVDPDLFSTRRRS